MLIGPQVNTTMQACAKGVVVVAVEWLRLLHLSVHAGASAVLLVDVCQHFKLPHYARLRRQAAFPLPLSTLLLSVLSVLSFLRTRASPTESM